MLYKKADKDNDSQHDTAYYRLLTRKMILTVITVSFAPMILVIMVLLYQFNVSYHEKTYAHLRELVQKHKQHIDTFLYEKLADIQFLAESNSFDNMSNKSFLKLKLKELRKGYGDVFVDLGVVDATGKQLAYAGPYELQNVKYDTSDWFNEAMSREYFISDVFMGLRGSPHFIITVRHNSGKRNYILRATIDFRAFNTLVENLRIGDTAYAFIVNRRGKFQTRLPFDNKMIRECCRYFIERVGEKDKEIRVFEKSDTSGTANIYVVANLKNGEWLLIYKQEANDAFADVRRMSNVAILIFLLGGACIIAMAFLLTKRMVKRIMQADQEKEKLNQQMIEAGKLASVGELAAGIAHEINNPVAIMVEEAGWIQDLLEEEEFSKSTNLSEIERALNQIRTQGRRCKEITHKLLSFARKTDTTVKDLQVNDLIKEIIDLSSQIARYNKVHISTSLEPNLPYVMLSPSEMQQLMLNLINNAICAMEKNGGHINIATRLSRLEKDHIVITVEDDGPGIPEVNLSRIFDPFFTTKPVGKGTGLGLSICYGIVQKMGGKIDVNSTVGKGTKFRIWIPFQESGEVPDQS